MVFSPRIGPLADALAGRTIPVVSKLSSIAVEPDVIHGQHFFETAAAIACFPTVGAVYVCHDWTAWFDEPPRADQIRLFGGISDHALERLMTRSGVVQSDTRRLRNWVDLKRFRPTRNPPARPARALALSNYMSEANVLPQIRQACDQLGIELSTAGAWMGGQLPDPASVLGEFDLVFARGRTALEAMASGAAVVQVDKWGLAGLVTPESFMSQSRANFGLRAESRQVTIEALIGEIERYAADAVSAVTQLARDVHGLDSAVDEIVKVYDEVIESVERRPTVAMPPRDVADLLSHVGELDRIGNGWFIPAGRLPEPAGEKRPRLTRRFAAKVMRRER